MGTYLLITPSRVSSGLISGWIQTDTSSLVTIDPGQGVLPIGLTFQESLIGPCPNHIVCAWCGKP